MQTTTLHNLLNNSISIITLLFLVVLSGSIQAEESIGDLALLDAADKWQVNRLLEPTTYQRKKESQGQIMIYDNLRDTTVRNALDTNFDRIENMMFTRVIITDESGQPELDVAGNEMTEDDGC
jgi:hypothetical protein